MKAGGLAMRRIRRWVTAIVLSVALLSGCGATEEVTAASGLTSTFSDGTVVRVTRVPQSDSGIVARGEVVGADGEVFHIGELGGSSMLLDGALPLPDGRAVIFGLVQGVVPKGGVVYLDHDSLPLQFRDGLFLSPALSPPARIEIQLDDGTLKSTIPEAP